MKYSNKTTAELKATITERMGNLSENALDICLMLSELAMRQEYIPLMRTSFFRHFEKIAAGKLDVLAAMEFAGLDSHLSAVANLPIKDQNRLAAGGTVKVAVNNEDGKMRIENIRLKQCTREQVNMALTENGYRAPAAQKKILAKRNPVVRRSPSVLNIRADLDTEEIVIGQVRIPVAELTAPLKELGFKLTRRKKLTASRTVSLNKAA